MNGGPEGEREPAEVTPLARSRGVTALKRAAAQATQRKVKPKAKRKAKAKRPGPGRPPFKPTDEDRERVVRLKLIGTTNEDIADILGVAVNTLVKHFDRELRLTRHELVANVAQGLYLKAIAGDTTAMIFMLRTQGGWSETRKTELSGPNGQPLQPAMPPLLVVEMVDPEPEAGAADAAP